VAGGPVPRAENILWPDARAVRVRSRIRNPCLALKDQRGLRGGFEERRISSPIPRIDFFDFQFVELIKGKYELIEFT
jgi:hypothetical protein